MGSGDSRNQALALSHLGIGFLMIVGGSIFLGLKADEKWGTSPLWVLTGFLLGFALGFYYLIKEVFREGPGSERNSEDDADSDAGQ